MVYYTRPGLYCGLLHKVRSLLWSTTQGQVSIVVYYTRFSFNIQQTVDQMAGGITTTVSTIFLLLRRTRQPAEMTVWREIQTRALIYQPCVEKVLHSFVGMKFRMCVSTKKSVFINRADSTRTHTSK